MQTVKGTQRQVVVVKTEKSRWFEEVFFVVRREARRTRASESEMLIEANRILRESLRGEEKGRRPWVGRLVWLLFGAALGAGAVALFLFLRGTA